MDCTPSQPVKDPPNLTRTSAFSLDRLLSHIDPGTQEESEEFVRAIYEQRHIDLASGRNERLLDGLVQVASIRTGPDSELYVLQQSGAVSKVVQG